MHPKYEFHEFRWRFQLGATFENQENHIKGEFGDILGPRKIPAFTLIMISDLKGKFELQICRFGSKIIIRVNSGIFRGPEISPNSP